MFLRPQMSAAEIEKTAKKIAGTMLFSNYFANHISIIIELIHFFE